MSSGTSQPLSLSEFGISPERGFLPSDPCDIVPDSPILNQLGYGLPKLLSVRQVRRFIDEQPSLLESVPSDWREEELRAAMRILSFAAHAYIWETPGQPVAKLPAQLAQPWHEIAQKLGRPPVLSYASYALDNWQRIHRTKPIELDNIVLLQNFLGGLDEEWFVVVHLQIENQAGPGLEGLVRATNGATKENNEEVLLGLQALASAQTAMRDTLLRMKERCDPYVLLHARETPTFTAGRIAHPCPMALSMTRWKSMVNSRSNFVVRLVPRVRSSHAWTQAWASNMRPIR